MAEHPYASLAYLDSLRHVGRPIPVEPWRTAALLRPIPSAPDRQDAVGAYPVCTIAAEADLPGGLQALARAGAVSVVLVSDPCSGPAPDQLAAHFPLCRPFKTHHLLDRSVAADTPCKHHRDRIRRGEKRAAAQPVSLRDGRWFDEWCRLYAGLVAQHGIAGAAAFDGTSFQALRALPADQLVAFAALSPEGETLAMQLWIRHGDVAYSHLTATSAAGYKAGATYVVYAAAIAALADCRVLDFGGGAGHGDDPADGLAQFKAGFANRTAPAYLCGAVLDPGAYAALSAGRATPFFPAYRG